MARPDSRRHRHHDPQRLSQLIASPTVRLGDRGSITEDIQVYQGGLVPQASGIYRANSPPCSPTILDICNTDVQQGSALLKCLNGISALAKLAKRYIRLRSHMIPVPAFLAQTAIASLEEDPSIEKMSTRDRLAKSILITGNTCRELELEVYTSSNTFCKMFTGPALRWEALGLLFTWAALALLNSPADDSLAAKLIAAHEANKAGGVSTMVYCSNLCISLCKEYAPASEVLLWLLHESLTLTLQFYGDCSKFAIYTHQAIIAALKASLHFYGKLIVLGHQAWQRLSDLATEVLDPTIVKLGARIPFIFTQTRRKIIASAYWIDKSLASLHGQVPRITCLPQDFETPLDIDDDELLLKGFDLLHPHSSDWNQSGYTCPATYIRARYILGAFRDELFQLSLIASTADRPPKLEDLSRRYRAAWLEMPNKLHYRDTDQVEAMPYMTSFSQLLLFLDYLQGEYLIYKELGGTIESTRPQLLWHCKRTLNIVISLFASPKMRAQTSPLERIRVGVLYGVPCAEYLILTLKEHSGENELKDHLPSPLELIRNISAFISSLNQEYHADDQLKLFYINTYRSLECAFNDILNSKQIYTLGFSSGTSSSTISPGSEISKGNNNIGSELIDWTDDLKWTGRSHV
ncbi:hypothetical protein COH20_006391 [Aspergillus flavus]|uniref:Transcription factor domain-containing protein n=1 Tax=Aspergillus flavus TaxID=5059 RepID=A0AB74CTK0_ASPFL|nr:hypothetical protein COH20_006391 [Aspergillus flavus]RAQ80522.1 hypothetical protein COH21_004801 [Aspergillus flavus]RMZ48317.1 hypothetical protein CA14_009402 [Aspergillus flavus]